MLDDVISHHRWAQNHVFLGGMLKIWTHVRRVQRGAIRLVFDIHIDSFLKQLPPEIRLLAALRVHVVLVVPLFVFLQIPPRICF